MARVFACDCRPDDVAARLHTECAGWNEKDPLKRFTDEHRMEVLDEVVDRGVHICTKQGSAKLCWMELAFGQNVTTIL